MTHHRLLKFIAVLIVVLISFTSRAQEDSGYTLALDNADITDLIRWASEVTDKNIILHPNVQGRVTVVSGDPMTRNEAYEAFLSILQVHGLTVVAENDSLKVIPDAKAKESAIPLAQEGLRTSPEDIVVKIVKLKNIPANVLITLIRPLVPQTGYLAAYPQTNTILIADRDTNIAKILNVIENIDQAGTLEIEMITLEFAGAKEVLNVLNTLIPKQGGPEQATGINLAVDERSNSILVTGDPVTRQQIRALIAKMDRPLKKNGNTRVFRIQYAVAADLVPIIENIVNAGEKSSQPGGGEIEFSIQPHEQLNALVITAPPGQMTTIKGVIKELDVPRAQVLVEALIVEVSEDLARNIGVEWRTSGPGSEGEDVFGGFSDFPSDISPLSVADGAITLGSGINLGYFRNGSLRGIINALAGETNANILSTPTIVSLDNEEAEILVGSNVPFITGSQQRAGDLDPFQTIQREDIGTTLKIKPRINNNDSVTLEIEQSVESISQSSSTAADIVTNKRQIKTRVLIDNDEILVLGGLMRDEASVGENRVPVLGKIPILGNLFKSRSSRSNKTNLMVFIHPRIVQSSAHLRDISREKYQNLRSRQLHFDEEVERFWLPRTSPLLPELGDRQPDSSDTAVGG